MTSFTHTTKGRPRREKLIDRAATLVMVAFLVAVMAFVVTLGVLSVRHEQQKAVSDAVQAARAEARLEGRKSVIASLEDVQNSPAWAQCHIRALKGEL